MKNISKALSVILGIVVAAPYAWAGATETYLKRCASCHHPQRYGISAPPLIPEYLGRKKEKDIAGIISNGLPATNMPAFKGQLSEGEINELASYVLTPAEKPVWGVDEMLSTLKVSYNAPSDKKSPYDLTNFFMIVEGGAGKVHFMDGDSFTLLDSIRAGAIHGGPKFDKDLRFSYIVSRDGWVTKYDIVGLKEAGRLRAGISSRNIAISSDSRYLAIANLLPDNVVLIDTTTMKPVRTIEADGAFGAVYSLRDKGEFVVAMRDSPEILVIDDKTFAVRKINIDQPFTDFFIEPGERYLVGTSREGTHITVVDVEKGEIYRTIKSDTGMPHLASAAVWQVNGSAFAAFPHIGKPLITVLDMTTWTVKKEIKIKGPGFFARTHDLIPHLWVDTGTDTIQLIDKKTLEVSGEVVPEKGKKAMHIEFTKDGGRALVSVWEDDGAVKIYDTKTLGLIKSLPFKKPVGKYNATNKKF
ncbi:MAG: c-type cytochrome [Deltaproteobacteria bacterium]|nr:c-type cytochrome [Deltaproteobacteria bacterium]